MTCARSREESGKNTGGGYQTQTCIWPLYIAQYATFNALNTTTMHRFIFQAYAVLVDLSDVCALPLYYCLTSPEPLLCLAALSILLHRAECVCVCVFWSVKAHSGVIHWRAYNVLYQMPSVLFFSRYLFFKQQIILHVQDSVHSYCLRWQRRGCEWSQTGFESCWGWITGRRLMPSISVTLTLFKFSHRPAECS